MAVRPKLRDIQKDYSSLKNGLRDLSTEFKDFKSEVKAQFKQVNTREVIRLLQKKNSPYSDKFRYTYEEISNMIGISTTEVANIAKDEGLARRNKFQGA